MIRVLFSAAALKAWLGAMIAAFGVAAPLATDGSISLADGIYIGSAFFGALGVVYGVGNSEQKSVNSNSSGAHSVDNSVSDPELPSPELVGNIPPIS